ncbi:hypothetical protein SEA_REDWATTLEHOG_195 [Gordonia phage RedWattleHog]|uniref:Uncharacterized protein n=1 Tax=Gordonia phage Stormageddon TaxID=2656541 RepID=A0A649VRF3_9CAUD|nr:minor tail protein [Gordonia phage Stormageddon]QGJ95056.1 hypothetical protein SEA_STORMAGEDDON_196 [Gordonia phage Stormageddon]QLF83698.1 hypothetical protein SEA_REDWATTLEHOG_195 [Gordonia phage RedWattleHog]
MAKLKNVGAYPNTEDSLGRTDFMNTTFSDRGVVPADVTAAMDQAKAPLALKTYIDAQDALYTTKSYADTQDNLLIDASQLGASNGIAQLGANSKVTASALPLAATVRSHNFTYGTIKTVSSAGVYCTSFTVPNPGFRWQPLWSGWTMSRYYASPYCFPGVSIRDSTGKWVARGYGSGRNLNEWYPTPITNTRYETAPPIWYDGSETFDLYYTREYGTGQVQVGHLYSWFQCMVVAAASSTTSPVVIT